jgi:Na+-driven multidrug efflux pump
MPDAAGRAIAGDSWQYAEKILVWAVAISISNAVLVPAQTGLRSLGATRVSAVVRTATMPLPALCTLVGGLLGDGYTAMMGLAVGSILTTLTAATAFELRFRRVSTRRRDR